MQGIVQQTWRKADLTICPQQKCYLKTVNNKILKQMTCVFKNSYSATDGGQRRMCADRE